MAARRHTRANPSTGRDGNRLWTPDMLPPDRDRRKARRKIQYRVDKRVTRQCHLRALAQMLVETPVLMSIFENLERTEYFTVSRLNTLLGNKPWPEWNLFRQHISVARPLPVASLRVTCTAVTPFDRVARPLDHQPDPTMTLIEWVTPQGPQVGGPTLCGNTQDDIRRGVEFYRCHRVEELDDSQYPRCEDNARVRTQRREAHLKWTCTECVEKVWLHHDWTTWDATRITVWCRPCSIARRAQPYHLCNCTRFCPEGVGNGRNHMCDLCRGYLDEQAELQKQAHCQRDGMMITGVAFLAGIPPRPQYQYIDEENEVGRNSCRVQCGREYDDIELSWNGITGQQFEDEIWRQCMICDGFVPGPRYRPARLANPTTCI